MLETLLIIAVMASVSVCAYLSVRCAHESTPLGLIEACMNAQWLCGEVHRCDIGGLWLPGPDRWTAVAAALARPAPRWRRA